MKKIINIFSVSIVCFAILVGCSKNQNNDSKTTDLPNEVEMDNFKTKDTKNNNAKEININLEKYFSNINGCAVLYNSQKNMYYLYNEELAKQEFSPYSTFKIISALSGLHNNVIKDETSTMNYNEIQYPNSEWNGNLNLKEAFQTSCIWYFRQIIDEVGQTKIQNELNQLSYGNCNISEWQGNNTNPFKELNGFWLNSTLKISPLEQVKVLEKIFDGKSFYSMQSIDILRKIMLIQNSNNNAIYGKTGSGNNGEAWFVGFVQTKEQKEYFAIFLNDTSKSGEISGNKAKSIAINIINNIYTEIN